MAKNSSKRTIDIRIFPEYRDEIKNSILRAAARAALAIADPEGSRFVSIVLADNDTLHQLNLKFRGFDEPTDVLSFGETNENSLADEPVHVGVMFPEFPGQSRLLGEILVAYPLAVWQANEHNVTVVEEISLLVIHGVLHLLGYDHATQNEEVVMKKQERSALAMLFPNAMYLRYADLPGEVR